MKLHIPLTTTEDRSYAIDIANQFAIPETILQGRRLFIVSNAKVWQLWGDALCANLHQQPYHLYLMEDGEQFKSATTWIAIQEWLLAEGANRKSLLLALGGGVVGDLTGFVASTFMRGIDFIQIPTTLLSQVDSSVGGKTAINLPGGKNMVGTFYQPRLVAINTTTLSTLDPRDYAAGLAEVVKYGFAMDSALFEYLENRVTAIMERDQVTLAHIIAWCCRIKSEIVAQDEKEGGLRAILNFGHTFGHVIEKEGHYCDHNHGEAVAVGMVLAARLAEKVLSLPASATERLIRLLEQFTLPTTTTLTQETLDAGVASDKKSADTTITFVLTPSIGQAVLTPFSLPFRLKEISA